MVKKKVENIIGEILKKAEKHDFRHLRVCQDVALAFKKENPDFNSFRFSKACGFNFDIIRGLSVSRSKLKRVM